MRRYVTIGSVVVATVLAGSAAAYAGPGVASPVSLVQPGPAAAGCPSAAPSGAAQPSATAPSPSPASPSPEPVSPSPATSGRATATSGGSGSSGSTPAVAAPAPVAALHPSTESDDPNSGSDKADSTKSGQKKSGQKKSGRKSGGSRSTTAKGAAASEAPKTVQTAQTAQPTPASSGTGAAAGAVDDACGPDTSAATKFGWGTPNRVDNFDSGLGQGWDVYDGVGHDGQGRRTPDSVSVKDGIMTITGNAQGDTAGMAWNPGQKYGRWEGRVRAPVGDPSYNALMLLWPDAENWPVGGEVDFMEMSDDKRQSTDMFLHYGKNNDQLQGSVDIDATQWHDWAVEWAPTHVTAYVDGKQWWTTTQVSTLPPGPMHLCIQLDWFPEGNGEVRQTQMQVAWVKQYGLSAANGDSAGTAAEAADGVGRSAGALVEGAADAAGQVTGRLTEGAPDPVPAVSGLVPDPVPAPR